MTVRIADWQEGDLYFDFSKAHSVLVLDKHGRGHGMTKMMKSVDFVVEWEDQFWLVEVKDPESSQITQQYQDQAIIDFFEKIQSKSLIYAELFPKFVDSLIYLGLDRGIPAKPMHYLTLIGLSSLVPAHLRVLSNTLLQHYDGCLNGPTGGWSKGFSVQMFNLELWNRAFSHCPVIRIETMAKSKAITGKKGGA